jgi:hypothetical protein
LQTVGDGILVVQVLDPTRSNPGAFVRAPGELRAGAFDYDLFHGGVGGSNPADWFLRNDFIVPPLPPGGGGSEPGPLPPEPGPLPPEPILPPEAPPESVLPPGTYPIIGPAGDPLWRLGQDRLREARHHRHGLHLVPRGRLSLSPFRSSARAS